MAIENFTRTKTAIKIYEDLTQEEYDALTKEPHSFYLVNGVGIYKGTTLISAGANSSMDEIVEELNQAIAAKQDTLVSGTNIKTINGESILGEGNIEVAASDDGVDTAYVENEVLYIDDDTSAGGGLKICELVLTEDIANALDEDTIAAITGTTRTALYGSNVFLMALQAIAESWSPLALGSFSTTLLPSDFEDQCLNADALDIYYVVEGNKIYICQLPMQCFVNAGATTQEGEHWVKTFGLQNTLYNRKNSTLEIITAKIEYSISNGDHKVFISTEFDKRSTTLVTN